MVDKRRRYWPNVALLMVSIGLTLGVLEWVARHLQPLDPYEIVPEAPGDEPIGLAHPTRGHGLRPNFRGHFVHPDFAGEKVTINSSGFRDRELSSEQNAAVLNVTVLGDSITLGMGVEAAETFCALAETGLVERFKRPVRIFNTGVPGYGALHEWVVLREEFDRQRPDIAVVAFYTGNDLQDVYGFYREHSTVIDLLSHLATATTISKRKMGRNSLQINGDSRKVLAAHPDAEIRFPLQTGWIRPGASLRFGVALKPGSWGKPGADGVRFEVLVEAEGRSVTLFDQHIDPSREPSLRGWNDREVDLSEVTSGDTLVLRTTAGPEGSLEYDWAVWATPHIFHGSAARILGGDPLPSRFLLKPVFKQYWQRVLSARAEASSPGYWETRSSLFRFLSGRLDNLSIRWGFKPPKAVFSYYMISTFEREMTEYVRTGMDLTMRTLQEMQGFMQARDGRLIVLLIPAKFQTEPETVRRFVEQAGLDSQQIDVDQPHRILLELCERSGITCTDLLPELRQRVASGEHVYFPEGHPNRLGHQIIARHLEMAVETVQRGQMSSLPRRGRFVQPVVDDHLDASPLSKPSVKSKSPLSGGRSTPLTTPSGE